MADLQVQGGTDNMGFEVVTRDHSYGRSITIGLTLSDIIIAETHSGQFSLHWTTNITASQFLLKWRVVGGKSRVLIVSASGRDPIDGYGYQFFELADKGALDELDVLLARIWLPDVTAAWQRLPKSPDGSLDIVGVASDHYHSAIQDFMEATGSGGVKDEGRGALSEIGLDELYPTAHFSSLEELSH